MSFPVGSQARTTATFTIPNSDPLGDRLLADPTTVTLRVDPPDGPIVIYTYPGGDGTIVRDSLGVYHALINLSKTPRYRFRWDSTGVVTASLDQLIDVAPSLLVPS